MAIKASGTLSFTEIVAEFADTPPHSLSEFYRGGSKVPTNNTNVPTSGTIRFSNFYNAVNRLTPTLTFSTNTLKTTVNPATIPGYVAGISDVQIVVNSGVYIWSDSTATPAMIINGGLAAGDTLTLINNGFIMGMGGNGGFATDTPGTAGGPAMTINTSLRINNLSFIGGGGGGGSMGGGGGAGGGTGGFAYSGTAGTGQAPGLVGTNGSGSCGGGGGRIMPGVGGVGGNRFGLGGGAGGAGGGGGQDGFGGSGGSAGNPGAAGTGNSWGGGGGGWGASGRVGYYFGFGMPAGGAGGRAINLNGNSITWIANGTVYGAVA